MRRIPLLLTFLSGLVVLAWWLPNRLHNPLAGDFGGKFNCLSYSGYRAGESPLTGHFPTALEVDEDLAQLSGVTRAIRTYSALEGPYEIPAIAQRHGLKMWQGIWLGGDRAQNAREMAQAVALAHKYPDTIVRLVVGNEVLLRRDLPVAELTADIDKVRSQVKQPVAYADVSDFWDQFPEVAAHVDVVLIHLLPFWEDVPTGIRHAVSVAGATYDHFVRAFPGKTIAVGETGWPGRGRQRADALPSRVNQARYLRGFIALAREKHFDYNFFEAYDQNWKYENEGIVGASWGLYGADRTETIPLSGPLREDPHWLRHAAISIAAGLVLTAIGLRRRAAALPAPATQPQLALLGMTLGCALGFAEANTVPLIFDAHVLVAASVNLIGQMLLAGLMMRRLSGEIAPAAWRTGADATRRVRDVLRLRRPGTAGLFEDIALLFLWAAAVDQILLVFDPRYREFPLCSFAVPLVVTLARVAQRDLPVGTGRREEVALALVLTAGALASAVQEGPLNGQSLTWNAALLVLSAPLWISLKNVLF